MKVLSIYDHYPLNVYKVINHYTHYNLNSFNRGGYAGKGVSVENLLVEIAKLGDKDQNLLEMRFREGLTYRECAERVGVSHSRVRTLIDKSINRLRHPERMKNFLTVPYADYIEKEKKLKAVLSENNALKQELSGVCQEKKSMEILEKREKEAKREKVMNMPLEEMGLSTRTFNCLYRANKRTLKDLTEMTEHDYRKVRNLGNKCIQEIVWTLKKYGMDILRLSYDDV